MSVRPVVLLVWVIGIALAAAPWFTGGREPVAQLVSVFAVLAGVLLAWRQGDVRPVGWGPLVLGYAGLMATAALSLLWTASRYSTMMWLVAWGLAGAVFWLAYQVSHGETGKRWLLRAYLASVAVFSVVGLVMLALGSYDRLTSLFYWPNPAAAYILPALFILATGLLAAQSRVQSWRYGAAFTAVSVIFLLTQSRAALIVFGFVMALYWIVSKYGNKRWVILLFTFILSLALSIGVARLVALTGHHGPASTSVSRFAEVATGQSQSGSDRLYYITSALNMWFEHPVGGVGAGAYGDVHPPYQQRVVSASANAHNEYVQILAELGIVGAVCLSLMLLALGVGVLRGLVVDASLVPVAFGLLALLMHMGLDIDASYPALVALAAALAGVLWRRFREQTPITGGRLWAAGLVALAVVAASLYQSEAWAGRGRAAQADEDYVLATENFGRAASGVAYDPDWLSAEALNHLALASSSREPEEVGRRLDIALRGALQAQAADPYDAQHWQLEGRIRLQRSDFKGARVAFESALRRDPFNHPAYAADLAGVLWKLEGAEPALKVARAMLRQYPPVVVHNRHEDPKLRSELANLAGLAGTLELELGHIDQAKADAALAMSLDKTNLRARALDHQVKSR